MKYRSLGSTGYDVSELGFGAWAIGADWGSVDDTTAMAALHGAVDEGVNFIDTADVYGDGRSERFVGRLVRERTDVDLVVATKVGRRLDPHTADGYTGKNIERFIDCSLTNLRVDTLDLVQLHCPPPTSTTGRNASRRSMDSRTRGRSGTTASVSNGSKRR